MPDSKNTGSKIWDQAKHWLWALPLGLLSAFGLLPLFISANNKMSQTELILGQIVIGVCLALLLSFIPDFLKKRKKSVGISLKQRMEILVGTGLLMLVGLCVILYGEYQYRGTEKVGLNLHPRGRFYLGGGVAMVIGAVFFLEALISKGKNRKEKEEKN